MSDAFSLTFWGVRGTVPRSDPSIMRYGGNTSCVEVFCKGRQIIFDAGTGLYQLGQKHRSGEVNVDILLSHTHLDHIQGFPFFAPLYNQKANIALWAGHLLPYMTVETVMSHLMQSPVFPLTLCDVHSRVEFNDFQAGQCIFNDGMAKVGINIKTLPLFHPDQATGYRLECDGKSICYITDVEHVVGECNAALIEFIRDADIFIYDSTYDDDEFSRYIGWGHSTWQHGVRLAEGANVKKFVAFHHDPMASDDILDKRAEILEKMRPGSIIAKEGLTIDLS